MVPTPQTSGIMHKDASTKRFEGKNAFFGDARSSPRFHGGFRNHRGSFTRNQYGANRNFNRGFLNSQFLGPGERMADFNTRKK